MKLKKSLVLGMLTLTLGTSGCLGPDNAFKAVRNWNANLSDHDWVNEIVFLGLSIIPVYGIALFADVVIFNTLTYWTGNPTIDDPGPFPGFTNKD